MVKELWIFLFTLGLIFFGWPIVSMFGHKILIYLFSVWFLFIAIIFLATKYKKNEDNGG